MDEMTLMLVLWKKLHWNMNMLTEVMLWTGWLETYVEMEYPEAYVLHEQMKCWMAGRAELE